MSSACLLLAPKDDPSTFDRKQTKAWETKLSDVIHYRGGFSEISNSNGVLAYRANQGDLFEFAFGEFPHSDELGAIEQMAESYPGHYLAAWTYGGVLTVWTLSREDKWETPESCEFSFRLSGARKFRQGKKIKELSNHLSNYPFAIDHAALRAAAGMDEISVKDFFAALGVLGAAELKNENGQTLWEEFETAANILLRGEGTANVRRINEVLKESEEEELLPGQKAKQPGQTARQISYARSGLEDCIGEPDTETWSSRIRAASYYWDLTDSEESLERLSFAKTEKGPGNAAGIARLLGHYPKELMRDGIFLAEAALEAEGANGHSYVKALSVLAERCHDSGFTLVIFPSSAQEDFRDSFGILPHEEHHQIDPDWSAEAFIDIEGFEKTDDPEVFVSWLEKKKCDGLVLRANYDGSIIYREVGDKLPIRSKNDEAILEAARKLWPRGVFPALGLPDLLEPGEWHPGAYSGWDPGEREQFEDNMRRKTEGELKEVRSSGQSPEKVPDFWILQETFPRGVYETGKDSCPDDGEIFFELAFPKGDWAELAARLVTDFSGRGLIDDYGNCWVDDRGNFSGYSRSNLSTALFCRVLSEVPEKTILNLKTADDSSIRYEIDFSARKKYRSGSLLLSEREDQTGDYDDDDEWEDEDLAELEESFEALGIDWRPLFPKRPMYDGIDLDSKLIDEILFEDGETTYCSLDLSGEEMHTTEDFVQWTKDLGDLGFELMGDLLCSSFNNVVMRCFGHKDRTAYAVIMMPLLGDKSCELYSAFEGGISVTTTTSKSSNDHPDAGAFVQTYNEDTSVKDLYGHHMDRVTLLHSERRISIPAEPTLEANAKAIHEFLSRVFGAML